MPEFDDELYGRLKDEYDAFFQKLIDMGVNDPVPEARDAFCNALQDAGDRI